jgi:hypothetical protein
MGIVSAQVGEWSATCRSQVGRGFHPPNAEKQLDDIISQDSNIGIDVLEEIYSTSVVERARSVGKLLKSWCGGDLSAGYSGSAAATAVARPLLA